MLRIISCDLFDHSCQIFRNWLYVHADCAELQPSQCQPRYCSKTWVLNFAGNWVWHTQANTTGFSREIYFTFRVTFFRVRSYPENEQIRNINVQIRFLKRIVFGVQHSEHDCCSPTLEHERFWSFQEPRTTLCFWSIINLGPKTIWVNRTLIRTWHIGTIHTDALTDKKMIKLFV